MTVNTQPRGLQKAFAKNETVTPDWSVVSFRRQCANQDGAAVREMSDALIYKWRAA